MRSNQISDKLVEDIQNNRVPEPGEFIPKQVQRWCIIRKYGENPNTQYIKIEITNGTDALIESLPADVVGHFEACKRDKLTWWERKVDIKQMPISEFQTELINNQAFPRNIPRAELIIEEGMVFLKLIRENRFVHFTYQARRMSEAIYNKLLATRNNEGSSKTL